jgi:hypothetical protein
LSEIDGIGYRGLSLDAGVSAIEIAQSLSMGNEDLLNGANALSHEVGKMLYAIIESTKKPVRED